MTLIEKYKVRLDQLNNGHRELYEGEKKLIIEILQITNRIGS